MGFQLASIENGRFYSQAKASTFFFLKFVQKRTKIYKEIIPKTTSSEENAQIEKKNIQNYTNSMKLDS